MTNTISSFESVELTAVSLRHQIQFRPEDELSSDSLTPIAIVTEDDSSIEYPEGGLKAYSVILGSFLGLIVNLGLINSISHSSICLYTSITEFKSYFYILDFLNLFIISLCWWDHYWTNFR